MLGPTARTQQTRARARVHTYAPRRIRVPTRAPRSRAAIHTGPRPWSPVMNGLRRLTLICHFISLIQPPRALSVPRQSHSIPPRTPGSPPPPPPPHPPPSHARPPRAPHTRAPFRVHSTPSPSQPIVSSGEQKKGERERERERRERTGWNKKKKRERERETLSRRKNASARPSVRRVTYAWPPN